MPYSPWLWNGKPFTPLTIAQRKKGGRDKTGQIVRHHIGGGHKRRLRKLDFMRLEEGPQDVVRIERDPGRSAHIALLRNRTGLGPDGGWSYIVAPDGIRAGDVITSYRAGVPKGLVPQWDAEVNASDVDRPAREAEERQLKLRRAKYLDDGFRSLEASLEPLRVDDMPAPAEEGGVRDEASFAAADAIEEPVIPTEEVASPEVVRVQVRSGSSSNSPSSSRSFSTSIIRSDRSDGPGVVSPTMADGRPKAPSIYAPKANPKWSQATAGIAPSFALNLLRTLIIKPGNVVQLTLIPLNTMIHCITLGRDERATLCRSAGTSAQILSHQRPDEKGNIYTFVRLQSGEVRKIPSDAFATIGQVSKCVLPLTAADGPREVADRRCSVCPRSKFHGQRNLGKAGRSRNLGRRPRVRGLAMNACVRAFYSIGWSAAIFGADLLSSAPGSSIRTEVDAESRSHTLTPARAGAGSRAASGRASRASTATRTETRCASTCLRRWAAVGC
jgi:ribosomal protein L2